MNEVPNRQKGKIMERNYEEIFQGSCSWITSRPFMRRIEKE